MHAIGLIIGHGYAKAVCGTRVARFPAIAALATAQEYESALGRGPALVQLNGQGSWLTGEEVLTFAPQRLVTILDRTRYRDASFVALARRALGEGAPEDGPRLIMTGMPGAWYADTSARSALEAALQTAAVPWGSASVRIAPEAAGVFYAYVFAQGALNVARTHGAVGVIDAGYRDVNVCLFQDGRYVAGESVPGGVVDALRLLKRRIAAIYGLELGLRRGEILALRWADIDFERKVLAVTGTIHRHSGKLRRDAPKTESSRRLLPLTDTLGAVLREHQARQQIDRERLGAGWVDLDLVFTTGHGTAIEPHNLFDHFKATLLKAGLPEMRFHDLRHSCASILLAQNVHPRVIMEILGHSEIGTTMNLYAHVVPEVQESAVQLLSQALAPKAKLARIEYERYDLEGQLIDSGTVEQANLALMARLSPKGWTLKARLIAQDGRVEERIFTCGSGES